LLLLACICTDDQFIKNLKTRIKWVLDLDQILADESCQYAKASREWNMTNYGIRCSFKCYALAISVFLLAAGPAHADGDVAKREQGRTTVSQSDLVLEQQQAIRVEYQKQASTWKSFEIDDDFRS
jgi:hypothetical protein